MATEYQAVETPTCNTGLDLAQCLQDIVGTDHEADMTTTNDGEASKAFLPEFLVPWYSNCIAVSYNAD